MGSARFWSSCLGETLEIELCLKDLGHPTIRNHLCSQKKHLSRRKTAFLEFGAAVYSRVQRDTAVLRHSQQHTHTGMHWYNSPRDRKKGLLRVASSTSEESWAQPRPAYEHLSLPLDEHSWSSRFLVPDSRRTEYESTLIMLRFLLQQGRSTSA